MDPIKEFSVSFHNLKGFTLGEKRKSLFFLLNSLKGANVNTLNAIVSSITPKDHLELIFRIEVLIHFRRSAELFEVLKGGNEELSSKIFKQPWFFQDPFNPLSAEVIVNELFCYLSFVTRNRVIKSLAKYHKNEEKIDEVFDLLKDKYGINSAKHIIQGCSANKIRDILKSTPLNLSSTDLVPMFNKDPHLFELFTKHNLDLYEDMQIIREVIFKETDIYIAHRKLFCHGKLGKRSTRRLLIHSRENIISNIKDYKQHLHLRTVYKLLHKNEAIKFLEGLFPEELSHFSYRSIASFLNFFPNKEQFNMCSEIFQKKYKKSLWDCEDELSDDLLKIMVRSEDKEKLISIKIKSTSHPENYYQYMEINKAINLIKEKLITTSGLCPRIDLLCTLISACKYHDDLDALKEVLEYFCCYFLNKEQAYRMRFLDRLASNFTLSDLSSEHWKYLSKILDEQKNTTAHCHNSESLLSQYILHLWKNKQNWEEVIADFIKNEDLSATDTVLRMIKCEEVHRLSICKMIELLPQKINDQTKLCLEYFKCLRRIVMFNTDYSKANPIHPSDFPLLVKSAKCYIEEFLVEDSYNCYALAVFEKFICKMEQNEFEQYLRDIYFEKVSIRYTCETIILWYLKTDPVFLSKYSQQVIASLCKGYMFNKTIWSNFKKLTYLGIHDEAIRFCSENYIEGERSTRLNILAFLMVPEDYLNVISKHIPPTERMDIDSEESKADYSIAMDVAASFKHTKSVIVLPMVLNFCMGDYLRYALESLYYLFYHSPENKLDTFVTELSDRAVSVRKHALFLTSQVGSIQSVFAILKRSAEFEKNSSMRKHLLNTALRYFKKSPSDKLFDLLLSCIPSMSGVDSESVESVICLRDIPEEYRARYFVFILEHLTALSKKHGEITKNVSDLLGSVDKYLIKNLSYDYCTTFIDKYFLHVDPIYVEANVDNFVMEFLLNYEHDFSEKTEYILNKLVAFKEDTAGLDDKLKKSKKIQDFLSFLICRSEYECTVDQIQIFYSRLFEHFDLEEYFTQHIDLKIIIMKKNTPNIDDYSKKVYDFVQEVIMKYSLDLIPYLACRITSFNSFSYDRDENIFALCFKLWSINKSTENSMFILCLLPKKTPDKEENCENYYRILEEIQSNCNVMLKVAFQIYINSLPDEDNEKKKNIVNFFTS